MRTGKWLVVVGLAAAAWGGAPSTCRAQRMDMIDGMYRAYLARPMTFEESRQWQQALRRGASLMDIKGDILSSDEFWNNNGARPRPWIRAMYVYLLHREPRRGEVEYWMDRLQFYRGNRQALAREFSRDAERARRDGRRFDDFDW